MNSAPPQNVFPQWFPSGMLFQNYFDPLSHNYPGHRLLILINILEINQYFSFSKNIDFCIDFAIDLGIHSETAKFDQIWSNFAWFWSNLIKFDQISPGFDQIWSNLIKFDQIWSNCTFFGLCHAYWFSTNFLAGFLLKKPGSKSIKVIDCCLRILIRINRWCPGYFVGGSTCQASTTSVLHPPPSTPTQRLKHVLKYEGCLQRMPHQHASEISE